VLLVTPKFYGIEKKIISVLKKSGYEVEWFENKELAFDYHGTGAKLKLLRKLWFAAFSPRSLYVRKKLNTISDLRFDILFAIDCFVICPYLLRKLKGKNPDLYTLLYMWDSSVMYSWISECGLFDKVFTFDRRDSEIYGWHYLPNFYINEDRKLTNSTRYDLSFVGKFSTLRFNIIEKIIGNISGSDIKYFIKLVPVFKNSLHWRWVYLFLKVIRIRTRWISNYLLNYEACEGILQRDYIIPGPLQFKDVQNESASSHVILDITFPGQTGYSHRLIEALANGKKVITTNRNIQKESFYNPAMIRIIDDKNPVIDCQWIKREYEFSQNSVFNSLELSSWLKSILNVKTA